MSLYPAVPGHRMEYDRDGSVTFWIYSGVVHTVSLANTQGLNSEVGQTSSQFTSMNGANTQISSANEPYYLGVLFPDKRDIAGYFLSLPSPPGAPSSNQIQTSTDTTTGLDGTWTNLTAAVWSLGAVPPAYRSSIHTVTASAVKGVRVKLDYGRDVSPYESGGGALAMHIYGQPSSGQNPDSLRFTDTGGTEVSGSFFDFGDIARGATSSVSFKIKNISAGHTANTVTLSAEALTDASPSLLGQFQFSSDGGATFHSSLSLGNLAAGASTGTLIVRDTVDGGAALSVWRARMVAAAGSWT